MGTGPFQVALHTPDHVILERNPRYAREPARVDRIEFRASLAASAIADGLRDGSLDIARDLLPQDLESILREPRFRAGLVETPKKNTYFAVFHTTSAGRIERGPPDRPRQRRSDPGPRLGDARPLRLARHGRDPARHPRARRGTPPDALPARGGRRDGSVRRGCPRPSGCGSAVHPMLVNQYAAFTEALFRIWRDIGVEVEIATKTMPEFHRVVA